MEPTLVDILEGGESYYKAKAINTPEKKVLKTTESQAEMEKLKIPRVTEIPECNKPKKDEMEDDFEDEYFQHLFSSGKEEELMVESQKFSETEKKTLELKN
ncbi:hypothetical protein JTB14_012540 [Gonioctena quinquepunctata]|nr:hypothetical protein JTB14_012540 [Gonioctena quinquepunctata]